ncbi:unnamed protein product [Caenorhabditis brenneri]
MILTYFLLFFFPTISISQYYNPSIYQSYLNSQAVPRQQTVLVPVYTQAGYGGAGYGGYPSYGMSYPSYGMGYGMGYGGGVGGGYPMMGAQCCGGGGMMMPNRESNAKKFLRGATEGVFMGSVGMLGFT